MKNNIFLKTEEKASIALRSIYKQYGFLPYKMSKFEEYDLYVRNKDFLVSDRVITFNDTSGKLLALKPDVTLSIIKNYNYEKGCKQKVYYNENVYRISDSTHQFKEIMQTGIECMGDVDINDVFETVYLAAKSLSTVSDNFILDISHMGIFSALLDEISTNREFKKEVTKFIAAKNKHESIELCKTYGISEENTKKLVEFIGLYGEMNSVLEKLSPLLTQDTGKNAYYELNALCNLLSETEYKNNIKLDFSVVNDMNYYNGIVFKGFILGVSEGVLSGGEYGKLMHRMGKGDKAIGFALYLDLLEGLQSNNNEFDVDVLLLYDKKTSAEKIISVKKELTASGKSISSQSAIPNKLRYKEIIDIREEEK